jgi:MoxR-like ATPase
MAAKARALLLGRTAPIQDDLCAVAPAVLRHRIIVNHRAVGDAVTSGDVVNHLLRELR